MTFDCKTVQCARCGGMFDFDTGCMCKEARSARAGMARPAPIAPVDDVNNPAHYTGGAVECIDAIQSALTPEEFRGFCKGNVLKYTWRERTKGGDQSMEKARWYLDRMLRK